MLPGQLVTLTFALLPLIHAATTLKLTKHSSSLSLLQTRFESAEKRSLFRRQESLDGTTSGGVTYTIDVSVGGTELPLVVDTGSTELWVPATSCDDCKANGMTLSTLTAAEGCSSKSMTYGIGSVDGCLTNTTLEVGDYTVIGLHVLAATAIGSGLDWEGDFMSGIWGLARDSGTLDGTPTAISLMYKQGLIQTPTIGFYLARDKDNADSEMTIGDVTSLSYTDTSKTVTLQSEHNSMGLYVVNVDSINVNGQAFGQDLPAYIDTGSTGISGPESLMTQIYSALFDGSPYQYASQYIVPCQALSNATISLTFGGMDFSMDPTDLIGDTIAEGYDWCYGQFYILSGIDELVIGDAFLHNVYHTVNVETGDVTFYGLT